MWISSKIIIRVPSVTFIQIRYERYLTSLHEKLMRFLFRDMIPKLFQLFKCVSRRLDVIFSIPRFAVSIWIKTGGIFVWKNGFSILFFLSSFWSTNLFYFKWEKIFNWNISSTGFSRWVVLRSFDINNSWLCESYVCEMSIALLLQSCNVGNESGKKNDLIA